MKLGMYSARFYTGESFYTFTHPVSTPYKALLNFSACQTPALPSKTSSVPLEAYSDSSPLPFWLGMSKAFCPFLCP